MTAAVIGLDIGTSSVKAAGFDQYGRLLATASAPIVLHSPIPGWAEQEPSDWWNAACQVLKTVLSNLGRVRVAGLGLSGQCPGHVLVTSEHEALGRAIIWRDQRAVKEATWLSENISVNQAQAWVGTAFTADSTSPPARLLWLKKHRSEDFVRAAVILQPKDYVALQLTGQVGTDLHSAYLLAHLNGEYNAEYFAALGIPL